MPGQHVEQVPFGRGQMDELVLPVGGVGVEVDPQGRRRHDPGLGAAGPVPQRRPHPGQEFVHPEGLGHVVVGARCPGPAPSHPNSCRADKMITGRSLKRPDPAEHGAAVEIGQTQIEDGQVGRRGGRAGLQGRCPGAGQHHHVAPGPEIEIEHPPDGRIVVDDQHGGHDATSHSRPAGSTPWSGRRRPCPQRPAARPSPRSVREPRPAPDPTRCPPAERRPAAGTVGTADPARPPRCPGRDRRSARATSVARRGRP